jgi:hypothetical protein
MECATKSPANSDDDDEYFFQFRRLFIIIILLLLLFDSDFIIRLFDRLIDFVLFPVIFAIIIKQV